METLYNLLPIIIMFVAMWLILVRPAQKRQKATLEMQKNLKRGDKVVTIGGLHGEVDALEDTVVYLIVDGKTRLKFERQAIGRVINE
ncbi:preprotein translocase subunit YajC [Ureibacillus sp. FSL K6-8385]|uniref:Preprotein translocase subunit YajC n=1 Tax=Ureibacillus terrenus TaxID=118246 RepID=A0A540V1H8_9BACL|nr:preprotein translocase subunit YajC [Ureibacillus terrenus]MED3661001.1 preprotein translocase subunit YajC [Ureibacillus terrenus]MED3764890.1 preprotein translocase subunit YajC [Ureibacillus terrenus]TQE90103.1 preprotein translocase subunit YajC [Ureibacillus terrenus]